MRGNASDTQMELAALSSTPSGSDAKRSITLRLYSLTSFMEQSKPRADSISCCVVSEAPLAVMDRASDALMGEMNTMSEPSLETTS